MDWYWYPLPARHICLLRSASRGSIDGGILGDRIARLSWYHYCVPVIWDGRKEARCPAVIYGRHVSGTRGLNNTTHWGLHEMDLFLLLLSA